jgi:hypothetical protein
MNLNDFVKFVSDKSPRDLERIVELIKTLTRLEAERAETIAALERLGFSDDMSIPTVPVQRLDLCVTCNLAAVMTVDGNRYCEAHGEMASVPGGLR